MTESSDLGLSASASDSRPRALGPRTLVLYTVDRELILADDPTMGNPLILAPWAKPGGLPLVGCLDAVSDESRDESETSI